MLVTSLLWIASTSVPDASAHVHGLRRATGQSTSWHILGLEPPEHKPRAVAGNLERLGGPWRMPAALLRRLPRTAANRTYHLVSRCRYRLGGSRERIAECAAMPGNPAARMLPCSRRSSAAVRARVVLCRVPAPGGVFAITGGSGPALALSAPRGDQVFADGFESPLP